MHCVLYSRALTTRAKMKRRLEQIEESVGRYLHQMDSADRQEPLPARTTKMSRLKDKIVKLKEEMQLLEKLEVQMRAAPGQQISLTDPGSRSTADRNSHHMLHVQSDWRVSSTQRPPLLSQP